MTSTISTAERAGDHERLARALLMLARRDTPTPCDSDQRFTSDLWWERREVLELCADCPIYAACAAAGRHEQHFVWAGVDRTPNK